MTGTDHTGTDSAGRRPEHRVSLRAGASTSAGRVRTNNQDRFLVVDDRLFIVADGMGGHVGGEVAAQLTVETLARLGSGEDMLRAEAVIAQVETANLGILTRARTEPDLRGMGTTLTGIAVVEGDDTTPALLLVINVGDSRTYWLRGGDLEQLSEDHSVVGELQREGKLTAVDARTHKSRSVLTRALGVEPDVECDVLEIVPIVGDRFLICSDGLPTELTDQTIAATLRQLRDPQEAAAALVREAVDHGGRDNVTVIVVDVVSGLDGSGVTANGTKSRSGVNVTTASGGEAERSARPSAPSPPKPKAPRRPWIVNVRVVLFFACLAAIAAVVVWTIQNDPSSDTEPTATTVTETTLLPLTLETTVPGEAVGDASASSTATGTAADAATVTESDTVSDPVPAAVVDPFAPTTTTTTATTTTKKPR
jgi:serine/threonine protein phosphatase PrpC